VRAPAALAAVLAALALAAACAAPAGCGGGGGGAGVPTSGAVAFVRGGDPAPILDLAGATTFTASELWVEVASVQLVETSGRRTAIGLAVEFPDPARFDLLALTATARLLALGAHAPGAIVGADVVLGGAVMRGVPAAGGAAVDQVLSLPPDQTFHAPFPSPVTLSGASALALEWAPSVTRTGATSYVLGQTARLFVVGGPHAGSPATLPVKHLAGDLDAQNCVAGLVRVLAASASVPVTTTGAVFLDHLDTGFASPVVDCTHLALGDRVMVRGAVAPGGGIAGQHVRLLHSAAAGHGGGSHHGSAHNEYAGVVRSKSLSAGVGTLELFQGLEHTATVRTGPLNGDTLFQLEDGTARAFADVQVGDHVQAYGPLSVQVGAAAPELRETSLVLIEQP
jgi:hypothetical protein